MPCAGEGHLPAEHTVTQPNLLGDERHRTVAATGHCQQAPTGSLTNEIQESLKQEEFGTGLDVKLM